MVAVVVLGIVFSCLTLWAMAAIYFDLQVPWTRGLLAALYGAAVISFWVLLERRWLAAVLTLGCFGLVVWWWLTLQPFNQQNWQPDVALLPYAETNGNKISFHNIRNCDYRTETDFDVHYIDKTFDTAKLRTADLFMVWWGMPYIAHTMVSFGFEGGDYLCFSIEARKTKGEGYSALKGFFRQYELIYIVGSERDLVRLRTNYRRGEEVYLYRLRGSPQRVRAVFMDYVRRVNSLRDKPEWYNAVTSNCTTSMRTQRTATDRAQWDWRMLINGHGDELLYERGIIDTNLPFSVLKTRCHINAKAKDADDATDFSRRIRQGVPGIEP